MIRLGMAAVRLAMVRMSLVSVMHDLNGGRRTRQMRLVGRGVEGRR